MSPALSCQSLAVAQRACQQFNCYQRHAMAAYHTGVDSSGQDGVQAEALAAQQPSNEQDSPRLLQGHPD